MRALCKCFLILLLIFMINAVPQKERKKDNRNHYSRSITSMNALLDFNGYLVENLKQFIRYLREKLDVIRLGINEMRARHEKAAENMNKFLANPWNSFSLLRHMQSDWFHWQLYMEEIDMGSLNYMKENKFLFAAKNDLDDAAEGIRRILKIYQLSPLHMAKGFISGVWYNTSLTPLDCYAMAKYNINNSFWQAAELWLLAANWSFGQPNRRAEIHKLHGLRLDAVYDDLARVRIKQNKFYEALEAQWIAVNLSPRNATLMQNLTKLGKQFLTYHPVRNDTKDIEAKDDDELREILQTCCDGKCERSKKLDLYCLYKPTTSHYLRLAPVKMEILSLDPFVVIYHDVISTKEQQFLKTNSRSHLTPTETVDIHSNEVKLSYVRTAKGLWLPNNASHVIQRITQRIEDITNLNATSGDLYQIINYGLGGLFETHWDIFLDDESRHKDKPDRISTMIFYLNDVPQGGATFFPNLNLTVFPKAGSALFWYNLDNAGDGISDVAHTGCPVIVGSKWIMTKWLNDRGQEFRKPCQKI